MKSPLKLSLTLLLSSALLSIVCINATAQSATKSECAQQQVSAQSPIPTIHVTAQAWTTEEKIAYDIDNFGDPQHAIPSVLITAKRLSSEQKLAIDKANLRDLHVTIEFNKILRKTA
ncbi:hypothetical protein [Undibacterium sp. Ren11W]|uniref:hypothetical protein n=1 Tax=Undibacterium sp. Ren11W TaxID=3413045 RepID=UPI003BF29B39